MQAQKTLLDTLTGTVRRYLQHSGKVRSRKLRGGTSPDDKSIDAQAQTIARQLVREALENGFPAEEVSFQTCSVDEGSIAQVARIRLGLRFIFKMQSDRKLVNEAQVIQTISRDLRLPSTFRDRFPCIYALKHDASPYAYLMEEFAPEDGYKSLAKELFESNLVSEALEKQGAFLLQAVLDAMLEGYQSSIVRRKHISIMGEDYVGRIRERLRAAAKLDRVFKSDHVSINGKKIRPWEEYLSLFQAKRDKMESLVPPFTTVVLGDPNPENILIRYDNRQNGSVKINVKFIDLKEWGDGDYMFDLAKLAHYINTTAPAKSISGKDVEWRLSDSGLVVNYTLPRQPWLHTLTHIVQERGRTMARRFRDNPRHDVRFQLAMAANLLGLPVNRWAKSRRDEAIILYAEGLLWLDQFSRNLPKI